MRYCTLILLLLSFCSWSQTMQGVVTDARTGKVLSPVTVVNVMTQQTVYTDDRGTYRITVKPGEVTAFSYIGYKPAERKQSAGSVISTLDIALEPTEYQLKEVQVRPGHLSRYQRDSADRVAIYRSPLRRRHPSPFTSPISALAELFSRSAKRTYRFQKTFATTEREMFIDTRYNADLVSMLTNLTGDSIGHFMYAYPMPYEYARAASDLEIKMWIRTNYREWIKALATDTTARNIAKQ